MAAKYPAYFVLTVLFLKNVTTFDSVDNITELLKDYSFKSHLEDPKVKMYCANRDTTCRSNNSNVCAFRFVNGSSFYRNFVNSCYLFLSNMCDTPGEEFHILNTGNCEEKFTLRRNDEDDKEISDAVENNNSTENNKSSEINNSPNNNSAENNNSRENKNSTESNDSSENKSDKENSSNESDSTSDSPILRQEGKEKTTTELTVDETFDYRPCPLSCPNIYKPVCVNVNRGFGKYFKMFTFVNHCMAALYYCKNPGDFAKPPDDEDPDDPAAYIRASPLGWSYCGASRYLQFARFAEVTSSMGHYGWLSGNYRYSHIMEPNQRLPGHG